MFFAVTYIQNLDPLNFRLLSTIMAALPVVVLFYLLVPRRWLASKAGAAGALVAILVAWLVYKMPLDMSVMSFIHGAGFGLLPVGWTVFNAMLLYNITVQTGQFKVVRQSISVLSNDARVQAILIGFSFGAFLEGSAGSGAPVAVCGAILVGLGFPPLRAAVICLIANTSPVAYGGLGTPIVVLSQVTDLPGETISVMAAHQLPILSCLIPLWMVKMMCSWKQTWEVMPAILVGGGAFAVFQYFFGTMHLWIPGLELYHVTDVAGGIGSMAVLGAFLRLWKPKNQWHFDEAARVADAQIAKTSHNHEAAAFLEDLSKNDGQPLSMGRIIKAWMPFAIMSICLILCGFLRKAEAKADEAKKLYPNEPEKHYVWFGPIKSKYLIDIPTLHLEVQRAEQLQKPGLLEPEKEKAQFAFIWASAAGTPVFVACVLSAVFLRMNRKQIWDVLRKTTHQMKVPIPTIACMMGLSFVTRYSGIDATLGIAFAGTGVFYPFFAAMLGWLGVFLTGTDAGSNALFGSLQKITATAVYRDHTTAFAPLTETQAQILICTANSTGGVMGKMIDAQSICVATAGTNQVGREADIFKAVFWHSVVLAAIIGLLTLAQAYLYPFKEMVPKKIGNEYVVPVEISK